MADALIRDEINYLRTLDRGYLMEAIQELVREKYEAMPESHIIENYERLA
jgi:hypothetical protein